MLLVRPQSSMPASPVGSLVVATVLLWGIMLKALAPGPMGASKETRGAGGALRHMHQCMYSTCNRYVVSDTKYGHVMSRVRYTHARSVRDVSSVD